MSELVCPKCGESFPDEDYCPYHGKLLVASIPDTDPERADDMGEELPAAGGFPSIGEGAEVCGADMAPQPAATFHQDPVHEAPSAAQTSAPSDDNEEKSKWTSIIRSLSRRRTGSGRDINSAAPSLVLPDELQHQGWRVIGDLSSRPDVVDTWRVEQQQPEEADSPRAGYFNRYRTTALTPYALYQRLVDQPVQQLAHVLAHGTVDLSGSRTSYEVVSVIEPCTYLDRWLNEGQPSEARAMHLLSKLVQFLRCLTQAGIQPASLSPDLLAFDMEDDRLWLTRAACLADASTMAEFHGEYANSPLLPRGWTAPEVTQDQMLSENAAVFSVGQILAQAVWGQTYSVSLLQSGGITFQRLEDVKLARILMGCLWPKSRGRWTIEQLAQALECTRTDAMPAISPWDSLLPGAGSTAFSFAGNSYWRLEDLLNAAAEPGCWAEAIENINNILHWAESTAWQGQVPLMRQALEQGRSADWVLITLRCKVCPDAPLTWRNLDLSDDQAGNSLVALAQRALQDNNKADANDLQALFEADLRGAFVPQHNHSESR